MDAQDDLIEALQKDLAASAARIEALKRQLREAEEAVAKRDDDMMALRRTLHPDQTSPMTAGPEEFEDEAGTWMLRAQLFERQYRQACQDIAVPRSLLRRVVAIEEGEWNPTRYANDKIALLDEIHAALDAAPRSDEARPTYDQSLRHHLGVAVTVAREHGEEDYATIWEKVIGATAYVEPLARTIDDEGK